MICVRGKESPKTLLYDHPRRQFSHLQKLRIRLPATRPVAVQYHKPRKPKDLLYLRGYPIVVSVDVHDDERGKIMLSGAVDNIVLCWILSIFLVAHPGRDQLHERHVWKRLRCSDVSTSLIPHNKHHNNVTSTCHSAISDWLKGDELTERIKFVCPMRLSFYFAVAAALGCLREG